MSEPKAATAAATDAFIQYTTEIVSAYVGRNPLTTADVPPFMESIYKTLKRLGDEGEPETPEPAPLAPAVPIRKSVTATAIICLECGRGFTSIRRHLGTAHQLTSEQYREKWQLPANYPMVTADYSKTRSDVAKATGLGRPTEAAVVKPKRGTRAVASPAKRASAPAGRSPRSKR
jgi:predicted transcriptional regulator